MTAVRIIIAAVLCYLCGCANGSIIISKYVLKDDIRGYGSGNAGLTNFYRTFGTKKVIWVIAFDMLKAVVAVLIGAALLSDIESIPLFGRLWGAAWCMLGHDFPVMFGFKGGKGVLSGGTITLLIDWRVALACWGIFLILAILTRYVSLGSIAAGAIFIVVMAILYPNPITILLSIVCGGSLIWGHRANIVRLIHGNERKFSFKNKGSAAK